MHRYFEGKAAIVTGGAGGIGAATARRLATEGARVLIADIAAPAEAMPGIDFQRIDMTSADEVKAMMAGTVERFGRLDILVNNAGVGHLAETPDMADEDWARLFAINVDAIFYACRAAIPAMVASGGGAIVNVASISGLVGDYGMGAYNASKGAVINYTRSLALDCSRQKIRVNAVCPGAIAGTGMSVGEHGGPEYERDWRAAIPLNRFGRADEMANVIAFLASDQASYMTGSIVVADGGLTAHSGQLDFLGRRRARLARGGE